MARGYILALLAGSTLWAQVDPCELVRRSLAADDRSWKLARDYTYVQRSVIREYDSSGGLKRTSAHTYDVMYIGGRPFRRLVQKDDRALSPDEDRKERERADKVMAERGRESTDEQVKRAARQEQARAKQREQLRDIPEAFDFTLLGQEKLASGNAYVLEAKPHPGYRGKYHALLSKLQGKLWIDATDYHWAKAEAETLDTVSFGLFIARLAPGSHIAFEQVRVNNEIWLPKSASVSASARLAVFKKLNLEQETVWSDYRKFRTDSKVTSVTALDEK